MVVAGPLRISASSAVKNRSAGIARLGLRFMSLRRLPGLPNVRAFSSMWDKQFTRTHEWIQLVHSESDASFIARVGISDFAQDQLGEVQAIGLPALDTSFKAGDEMCSIESIKTISSCNAVSECHIVAVNKKLEDDPTLVNSSPQDEGWFVEVKFTGVLENAMDRATYEAGCKDGSIPP
eukprot:TRINITY_DN19265_c0_g1_i2.p1 TRINITY_DN19265_c0_g1~~TRINITY_DN19265_c0_g1_i2.p1  ORF type:complete len:196 (-),score=28.36 TRINITY_DN19265_c0_g1_i2:323-859(-)